VAGDRFEETIEELMAKLDSGPGSHLDVLSAFVEKHPELEEIVDQLKESLQSVCFVLKYMAFDIEATRRERDQLRTLLEDQD